MGNSFNYNYDKKNVKDVPDDKIFTGFKKYLDENNMLKIYRYIDEIFVRFKYFDKNMQNMYIAIAQSKMEKEMKKVAFVEVIKRIMYMNPNFSLMKKLMDGEVFDIIYYQIIMDNKYDINRRYIQGAFLSCTDLCYLQSILNKKMLKKMGVGGKNGDVIALKYFLIKNGAVIEHKSVLDDL